MLKFMIGLILLLTIQVPYEQPLLGLAVFIVILALLISGIDDMIDEYKKMNEQTGKDE